MVGNASYFHHIISQVINLGLTAAKITQLNVMAGKLKLIDIKILILILIFNDKRTNRTLIQLKTDPMIGK